jgi:SlyX protein
VQRRADRAIVTKPRPVFLSNSAMEHSPHEVAERLNELEIKASYAEDLLEQLNLTIYRQQQQIDGLLAQLGQLREQVQAAGQGGAPRNLRDELPPHY